MRVAIIGGGIIGLSAAVALMNDGHVVTVVDADHSRSAASWGNAGHIATEQTAPLASIASIRSAYQRRFGSGGPLHMPIGQARHWLPFVPPFLAASRPEPFAAGQRALRGLLDGALPAWIDLATVIGAPALVKADGHYVVWETARNAASGAAAWEAADIGTATVRNTTIDERARIAALTIVAPAGAIRFAGSGQIADLGQLAAALESAVARGGGTIVRGTAELAVANGRAAVAGHESDLVILAAGVRSGRMIACAGHRAPLIAERGYHIRADADEAWPGDMPPIVFEDRSMIVTRYADSVQASGFVEFGAADAAPDPRKWERLEAHVRDLGLPLQPPFTRWMGARPTLPDYLPAIGRSRRFGNLLYAFGHQHLGLTLAPMTATILTALARDEQPAIDIASFAIERFGVR